MSLAACLVLCLLSGLCFSAFAAALAAQPNGSELLSAAPDHEQGPARESCSAVCSDGSSCQLVAPLGDSDVTDVERAAVFDSFHEIDGGVVREHRELLVRARLVLRAASGKRSARMETGLDELAFAVVADDNRLMLNAALGKISAIVREERDTGLAAALEQVTCTCTGRRPRMARCTYRASD